MTTSIEWTDTTWNPTTGCDRVTPGCDHCYALTMAKRLKGMGSAKYQRDGDPRTSGPGFGITEHSDVLTLPLRWRKPRQVFVNSMSDLFHDGVSDAFIWSVWCTMAVTPRHTYQILTKRHGRMRSLLNRWAADDWIARGHDMLWNDLSGHLINGALPNVHLGVSVEDQKRADLRIPALLDTPAAVRFLSCEPLLGPVDLAETMRRVTPGDNHPWDGDHLRVADVLHWVIAGGESGPGARPMHPTWARSLRDQCVDAGIPFLFKQWGDWSPVDPEYGAGHSVFDYVTDDDRVQVVDMAGGLRGRPWAGWKVQDGTRDATPMRSYGKKAAGRSLDGRTWDEYPAVSA